MSTAVGYRVNNASAFAYSGAQTKSVLSAIAPSGHGLSVTEADVSLDGVTSSAVPMTVELCTSTQAGAGTSAGTSVIKQVRGRSTSGSAPTSGNNFTAEPTTLTSHSKWFIPQFMGSFTYQLPLGREVECDSSGGTDKAHVMRLNSSASVNALANMEVENL